MSRVLVAEDSVTQAEQIRLILEDGGYEVEIASDGLQALQAIEREVPAIVLTDLEMPHMNGLQLVEAIRKQYSFLPVVLFTAYGSEDVAALALQKGAVSYIPKRYLTEDMIPTVENILTVVQADRNNQRVFECLKETETSFVLPNDLSMISSLIGYLEDSVTRMQLCDQAGLIQICVALRESLINAIEHGNLEVSSELAEQDEHAFHEQVRQRQQQEPYRSRGVSVRARVSREKAEFVVRDEGPGFDPSILPDPTDPANLERIRGRGLLLIRTFMDQVHHNQTGNEITMIKRRDRSAESA